ncbi:RagB/SusD family nutrient uptake outer membrane protein [Aquimarina muelleri]|uniref:Glycan metabolism protein RagB n=1 Tax=Aquimarina muelleri TaxID=279356 RepID=A0A918N4B6_9FLAO|nr:RagB/SusD family nutrient uptake outer membrane protein [Aquimarina muelleri]MCX2762440.1 RagB/SusD family nutrient uptake outer membrane protein [Aquimarina muelleri]GGX20859.1 glycan metabolism protein RagB [Aquimarina muelleri]
MKKIIIFISVVLCILSCDRELEIEPQGALVEGLIEYNEKWVDLQLTSAYAILDGNPGYFWAPASNWALGDVASDDFHKGSSIDDQPPLNDVERFSSGTTNIYVTRKWESLFEGVSRANQTLESIEKAIEEGTAKEKLIVFGAEARFLRAYYHMDAKKIWNNIPFITRGLTETPSNEIDAWPMIEEDLIYAINNLPETQDEIGRATSWVAKSYLAKAHMFQKDHQAASTVLDNIINEGPYQLVPNYHDNFNGEKDNNSESVFAVQNSVNDGGDGYINGNRGNRLNHPYGSDAPGGGCCGFFQPSQNLVNAFKTDTNGLPLLDSFNESDVTNDQGINSDEPFTTLYTGNLDPRLDWTVGRRGIEYLGWGPMPGSRWIRDQSNGGPYVGKKHEVLKSQEGTISAASAPQYNAINTPLIRYSDILLWRAEIYAENGLLGEAMNLVNQIRARAANPDGFVKNPDGTPAANYRINQYTSFPDKEYAIKAVRFERRLELASEGHRFFDLVRWGIAPQVLNKYINEESSKRVYLNGANFTSQKNEYYPIPLDAINSSKGALKQNSGY